jgi:hypothetical protein
MKRMPGREIHDKLDAFVARWGAMLGLLKRQLGAVVRAKALSAMWGTSKTSRVVSAKSD